MHKFLIAITVLLALFASPLFLSPASAQVFGGPGLEGGVDAGGDIDGPLNASLRDIAEYMLRYVIDFLALAAVIVIVVAGIWLVVGTGSDDSKTKAKTIIIYTIVGLLVVLLARAVVGFITIGIF